MIHAESVKSIGGSFGRGGRDAPVLRAILPSSTGIRIDDVFLDVPVFSHDSILT